MKWLIDEVYPNKRSEHGNDQHKYLNEVLYFNILSPQMPHLYSKSENKYIGQT